MERDDVAGQELAPEGDEQARADARVIAQREREAVGEGLREPLGKRDLGVEGALDLSCVLDRRARTFFMSSQTSRFLVGSRRR